MDGALLLFEVCEPILLTVFFFVVVKRLTEAKMGDINITVCIKCFGLII